MKGIVAVSHGKMAEGLVDTANFIMGGGIEQITSCCLREGESAEDYGTRLSEAIASVDTGDGVIITADLFGGTPCNQSILRLNEKNELIAGINFPTLIEILITRETSEMNVASLIEKGKNSLVDVKMVISNTSMNAEDE